MGAAAPGRLPGRRALRRYAGVLRPPPITPRRALRRLLVALGTDPAAIPAGTSRLEDRFRAIATRRMLLVLDNVADPSHVEPLAEAIDGHHVLVASRHELAALALRHGATRVRVGPLPDEEAARLLAGVQARPRDREALLRLCGGLPIALEVVRERCLASGTADGLAEELASGEPPLEVLRADRQRSSGGVRGVIDTSYRRLGDRHRAVFRRLGVIPGPDVHLETAAAVLGVPAREARRSLDVLAERTLFWPSGQRRWTRHGLVAAFERERLADAETAEGRDELRGRLTAYYVQLARSALHCPDGPALDASGRPADRVARAEAWERLLAQREAILGHLGDVTAHGPAADLVTSQRLAAAPGGRDEAARFLDLVQRALGSAR